jgi:putative polymerase
MLLYTLSLALIRYNISPGEGLNLKVSRDFLIPIAFFLLGKSFSDVKAADRVVYVAMAVVLFFALFEYFFLEPFLRVFQITQYYVARGSLDELDPSLQWAKGLMVSGMRPSEQGRGLLAFLGQHRVSSLFLEPISLGNFGCIVAFWGIVRSRMERQVRIWSIAIGIVFIVLSDTRFDAYFLGIGVLILLLSPRLTTPGVIAAPFVVVFALYFLALHFSVTVVAHERNIPFLTGLSIWDRLFYSGRVLLDFDIYNWFGFKSSRGQTMDAGYGYVISNAGIIGLALFWYVFMSLKGHSRNFYAFRNTIATFFAALFCISASLFTIKTAALIWFLMGVLSVAQDREALPFANRIRQ